MKYKLTFDLRKLSFADEDQEDGGGPCSIAFEQLEDDGTGTLLFARQHGTGHEISSAMHKWFGDDDIAANIYNHGQGAIVEAVVDVKFIWSPVDWRKLVAEINKYLNQEVDTPNIFLNSISDDGKTMTFTYTDGVTDDQHVMEFLHRGEYTSGGFPMLHLKYTKRELSSGDFWYDRQYYHTVVGCADQLAILIRNL